jgi:diguanylate cyclase (GGDEF)-like protein
LWPKSVNQLPSGDNRAAAKEPTDVDILLDTLGHVLREFGRYAFDMEPQDAKERAELFEQWAEHAQIGAKAPVEPSSKGALKLSARNWTGLRSFFSTQRRNEFAYVAKTQEDLRHVIWAFLCSMNRMVSEDAEADAQLQREMQTLVLAAESQPTGELKRIALRTIDTVGGLLDKRKERHKAQLVELGAKLHSLGEQLEVARMESAVDGLTSLFNRRAFDDQLVRTVEIAKMVPEAVYLLMLDVDHFKKINDRFGHPAGDAVLKALGGALVRAFKRKRDFVARYGGEEFALIVRDVSEADVLSMGDRLLSSVRKSLIEYGEFRIGVTLSMGATQLLPEDTAESWVGRADQALYEAKNQGRDRVVLI